MEPTNSPSQPPNAPVVVELMKYLIANTTLVEQMECLIYTCLCQQLQPSMSGDTKLELIYFDIPGKVGVHESVILHE